MKQLFSFLFFFSISNALLSQQKTSSASKDSLYQVIQQMDSIFFHAFNTCDTTKSKALFTKDLEFYHDAGGLTNYEQNLNSIRYRCTNKGKVRRELVEGSLEVYPIANYGAIEIGLHKFYYTQPGKTEQLDGTFRFTHIWLYKNKEWKISRVISYDH
ncbi:nuclear transport factor 2 family protein [Flavihumibacter sp. UBA7668]|uniref:nuclear transport factor 2 family protein n=1 Tax=Flavihumibacter sp. UBA7668 TaxID=1946542 RepID=UPI0025BFBADA|nr:nuclear transport factor 2 family protein [Flavihumibacter sp. UBA7668]